MLCTVECVCDHTYVAPALEYRLQNNPEHSGLHSALIYTSAYLKYSVSINGVILDLQWHNRTEFESLFPFRFMHFRLLRNQFLVSSLPGPLRQVLLYVKGHSKHET